MATLKIYSGSTGMQESLAEIERHIAQKMASAASSAGPRDARSMLAAEEENQARGRRLADLFTLKDILHAHLDVVFIDQSLAAGRARLKAEGARKVRSCGWCWTRIEFRGGLKVRMQSPYLRRGTGSRKKKRGKGGTGIYPLLARLGFEEKMSPASRAEIARQSVLCASYEEAAEQLGREGLEMDASRVGRIARTVGSKALELREERLEQALSSEPPKQSSLEGKRVRISLDGGRTRIRKTLRGRGIRPGENGRRPFKLEWKEPRVLTVDLLTDSGEPDRSVQPIYESTLEEADGTMRLLAGTLRLLGLHLAAEVLFVADGAPWIWKRIERVLLDEVKVEPERLFLVLDYYHATEKITEALVACKDLGTVAREALRRELCSLLLEPRGAELVIEQLAALARGRRARPINRAIAYLHSRLHLMDYPGLRERRLSIGSGVVESAVRRVINLRFKSASMCWRTDHIEPLLYLRAILKAGRWDQFFQALLQGRHWLDPSDAFLSSQLVRRNDGSRRQAAA